MVATYTPGQASRHLNRHTMKPASSEAFSRLHNRSERPTLLRETIALSII